MAPYVTDDQKLARITGAILNLALDVCARVYERTGRDDVAYAIRKGRARTA